MTERFEKKRIAIVGSGANGTAIGVDLIRAGHDVALIDQWPEHVAALRAAGATIGMPSETVVQPVSALHICDLARVRPEYDVALILVKAYDVRWACELISPFVVDDGLVVGVQNGMTAEAIADIAGRERTLGCVIEISSKLAEPGLVDRHSPPDRSWFAIGSLGEGQSGREPELAELLGHSGSVEIVDDILSAKWMKLVSNCATLVPSAVLGMSLSETLTQEGMRELMVLAGEEALEVGLAAGHRPVPIFGLTGEGSTPAGIVENLIDTLRAGFVLEHTTSTVLHDWNSGRRSEAHEINGLVGRMAEELRLDAPVNKGLVALAARIERGELDPSPHNLGLAQEIAGRSL